MTITGEWIKSRRPFIGKVCRYGFTRLLGVLGYVGLLAIFVELMGQDPVISSAASFTITVLIVYFISYAWVFQSSRTHLYSFPRFLVSTLVAFLFNLGVMFLTVNIWGWWYVWGQLSATVIVPLVNFLLSFYWSFR